VEGFVGSETEPFQVLRLADVSSRYSPGYLFKYDVIELATVLKPELLMHLLSQGFEKVVFLDPDILVVSSLQPTLDKLDDSNVVLTPHLDSDYPADGEFPNTETVLRHGIYNLGFIAVKASEETTRMLRWWDRKIGDRCFRDYSDVHYVDQRVMDLAPVLFERVQIARSRGLNVAWWNIHSRTITESRGKWYCDGEPLVFVHFSSFDPNTPHRFSRKLTRQVNQTGLEKLCGSYAAQLTAEGFNVSGSWPYTHDAFSDGTIVDYRTRQYYRTSVFLQLTEPDPFSSRILRLVNAWNLLGLWRVSGVFSKLWVSCRILFGRCWHPVFSAFRKAEHAVLGNPEKTS
jgi:hypothetical protein